MRYALEHRPKTGGFPFLAECLRKAGVVQNTWTLPAAQSVYVTEDGAAVVQQGNPLVSGMVDIPPFDKNALIAAIRKDQAGKITFPEFLMSSWNAGVICYVVDFLARTVSYYGARGEEYGEKYPAVEINDLKI